MTGDKIRGYTTTAVLVLAAVGLGVFAYVDRDAPTTRERTLREGTLFPAWRREEVTRIAIQSGSGTPADMPKSLVLERARDATGDSSWFMREPRNEPADDAPMQKLLQALEYAATARTVSEGAAAPLGLDTPRYRVSVDMGGVRYHLTIGSEAPRPKGAAYARLEVGSESATSSSVTTTVISGEFVAALAASADTYRLRTLVPYLSIELSHVAVTNPNGGFAFERVDDVSFRLGNGFRASRKRIDEFWGALADARAESFLADEEADRNTGLTGGKAPIRVRLTPKDGAHGVGELLVGAPCGDFAHVDDAGASALADAGSLGNRESARTGVTVFRVAPTRLGGCAPRSILHGLSLTAADLIDHRLFAAQADEIAELRLETLPGGGGGAIVELARKESGWHARSPVDRDLQPDEVEAAGALVAQIAAAEGTAPSRGALPPEARVRVTVLRAGGNVQEVITLGPADATGGATARRLFDDASLHVDPAVVRALTPRQTSFRGKELTPEPLEAGKVRGLEVRCGGKEQRVSVTDSGFRLEAPEGYAADNGAVVDLIEALTRARAESWVADADDGSFGLEASTCTVHLTTGAAEPADAAMDAAASRADLVITLGQATDGGYFARTNQSPAVFVLAPHLRELASRWLVDRHGFLVDPEAMVGATLVRAAGKSVPATPDDLAALTTLVADEVSHLGPPGPEEGLEPPRLEVRLPADASESARRILFGRATPDGAHVYARLSDVNATFAVARARVADLLAPRPRGDASP